MKSSKERREEFRKAGKCYLCKEHRPIDQRSKAKCRVCMDANLAQVKAKAARNKAAGNVDLKTTRRRRDKKAAIEHYGGKCARCGERIYEFLCFDHVNDDGAKHRILVKPPAFPTWLKNNGYPDWVQTLCFNCNAKKEAERKRRKKKSDNPKSVRNLKVYYRLYDGVVEAYGGRCVCCGVDDKAVLHIDHVKGGGVKQYRAMGPEKFYRWLRDNGYPTGYRILCANCNCGRVATGGACPHEAIRDDCEVRPLTNKGD